MVIEPQTKVRLFSNIPCDPAYENALNFDTLAEQTQYFMSKTAYREYTNFNFITESSALRVPENMATLYNINYIAFQNATFGNKWFYAFVDRMEYYSSNSTAIFFTMDEWQTWRFELTFHKCFIERECVSDDLFGNHLLPENLDKGEYICNGCYNIVEEAAKNLEEEWLTASYLFIYVSYGTGENDINVQCSGSSPDGTFNLNYIIPNTVKAVNGGLVVNGLYTGTKIYVYPLSTNPSHVKLINDKIAELTQKGQIDAITAMYNGLGICMYQANPDLTSEAPWSTQSGVPFNSTLGGYTPRNNKLLTQPFNYILLSDNVGNKREYGYEYGASFTGKGPFLFTIKSALAGQPTLMCVPTVYRNIDEYYDQGLSCTSFPLASFAYSAYQNELGLNRMANTVGAINDVIDVGKGVIGNIASANIGGAITSGISAAEGIADKISTHIDRARAPMSTSGTTSTSIIYGDKKMGFMVYEMSINPIYAKRLDDYFSMFGYLVNEVKDVELHSRKNWNYIKTVGANITGNCPKDSLLKIKSIFNRGITLWHTSNFDYGDMTNDIR